MGGQLAAKRIENGLERPAAGVALPGGGAFEVSSSARLAIGGEGEQAVDPGRPLDGSHGSVRIEALLVAQAQANRVCSESGSPH